MNDQSTPTRLNAASRWTELRRLLDVSARYPRANVALIALTLLAAGWALQERVFGIPHGSEPHLLLRALLAATPLVLTSAMVLALRRR